MTPTLEEVRDFFEAELPFFASFGFELEKIEPDIGVVRWNYDDKWTRPFEIVNGGTMMALADVAVYVAVFSRVGIVPLAVTNEMKMNFLRPAIGGDVIAHAELLKLGRRVAYAAVDLFVADDPTASSPTPPRAMCCRVDDHRAAYSNDWNGQTLLSQSLNSRHTVSSISLLEAVTQDLMSASLVSSFDG